MKRVRKSKDRGAGLEPMTTGNWLLVLGAFTLIELLVVISIIAILASLIFPVMGAVNAAKIKNRAKAELAQIETAIQRYQTKLGIYPPDNPGNPATNQLFYELMGTTNTGTTYITLDGSASLPVTAPPAVFGPRVGGFVNSTRGSSGDEASSATKFLTALKPNQLAKSPSGAAVLVGVPWQQGPPPFNFDPFGSTAQGINPWRYNSSSPTNNPNSYDLWIEVRVGSKTFLICNWSKQPLPIIAHDPY